MWLKLKKYGLSFKLDMLLVFALGIITAFAFPPYDFVLAAIPAFSIFILLIYSQPSRAFMYGLFYGLGQFFFAFHWLMPSMTEFGQIPETTAYALFFAVCAEVALYPALFAYVLAKLGKKLDWSSLLLTPALWVLTEWLRSNMFPFAWNLIGYSFYPYETLLQISDLASVYLLSFIFVFFSTSISLMIALRLDGLRRVIPVFSVLLTVFVFVWAYGIHKLDVVNQEVSLSKKISVAAIQGNIPQQDKWRNDLQVEVFDIYMALSRELSNEVDLIVWPESSLPFFLQDNNIAMQELKLLSLETRTDLLIGADTYTGKDEARKFFNSLLLINTDQGVAGQYNKFHRVPFGEYMPLREYLPESLAGFSLSDAFSSVEAGTGVSIMPWKNIKLGPLICYESIFPRHSRALAAMGADIFVNVSNDAWFGEAAKPQHLLMTRLRAIENRRSLVRVSNTGMTQMFDAAGNTTVAIESGVRGYAFAKVPLTKLSSINALYGQYFIVFCLLVFCYSLFMRYGTKAY
ncbi:MAG: apolipoprotein N-acyltransferase [Gammaproteobacteria bacterium]|nr:apolipoprotein N-acyltransferase [Gammaproteobacteria bacterium]